MKKRRQRRFPVQPAPRFSGRILVTLNPHQVGMFRFLLESYENLAAFTVLDRHAALLKIFYSPHQEQAVLQALAGIEQTVPLRLSPWPTVSMPNPEGAHQAGSHIEHAACDKADTRAISL